jgi:hypothetical protein
VPIGAGSLDYAAGPVIAFAVLGLLALFLRWAFGTRVPKARPSVAENGLLVRVATLSHQEAAQALRAVLSDAGIRSTVRFPGAHRTEVLVFPEDAERARVLASSFRRPD